MARNPMTANRLIGVLCVYFLVLLGVIVAIGLLRPDLLPMLPVGGNDVLEIAGLDSGERSIFDEINPTRDAAGDLVSADRILMLGAFLGFSLGATILVMLPVTWTYAAVKREVGYPKSFARALIVLPVVASTTVLLIQNNLALAFGLAAMVAAVRFRVALQEAIDGIFIFAAICVGLAAGIGHIGVATVMTFVFCLANAILWKTDFGNNPMDDLRAARKKAKLEASPGDADAAQ